MTREQARQYIRVNVKCADYLQKSKNGQYCCPVCHSGTGTHQTGAVTIYPENLWHCHACNTGGDVIDLCKIANDTDFNGALSLLADEQGIIIDQYTPETPTQTAAQSHENAKEDKNTAKGEETAKRDYMGYYEQCRQNIADPAAVAYLEKRGISLETAKAYYLGYDAAADPANAPGGNGDKKHPCPRLIIPTNKGHYVGRRIDGQKDFEKINAKGSSPGIFNNRALYAHDVQEVFVCEGAFDALSILEAGYNAIALNSAGNYAMLLQQLESRRTGATLILCPDNDQDTQTADKVKKNFATLADGLQRLNISHITADINGQYKDANEHLTGNKAEFIKALAKAQRQTAAKPDNTAYYIKSLMGEEVARFKSDKKTGFNNLDKQAGGLYSGLYALAAISSLGKTSFALQIADQLAENGTDVIYFSLEQSRLELVSKSIARRTVSKDSAGQWCFDNAVNSLSIRKGYAPPAVKDALASYADAVGDRVSIIEGNFNCDISFIGNYVRQYIKRNNTSPVVFVDYLQILQPIDDKQNIKAAVDSSITELKRISRELDLTIIVICSVNRANYLTPIDFESLKESGNIEYSCDVIWGLQLQCLNEPLFEQEKKIAEKRKIVNTAKAETPRKIELVCLKNRYGTAYYNCYFDYYPANDLFTEYNTDTENPFLKEAEKKRKFDAAMTV